MRPFRRLLYWLQQRRLEAELDEEMRHHKALAIAEVEREGVPTPRAEMIVRRRFGNVAVAREESRGVWIWPWLASVWQDAAYAVRTLRRQPGFTGVALLVLGVSIGLHASLFTVLAGMALRPLAGIAEPSDVVFVSQPDQSGGPRRVGLSVPELQYLTAHARSAAGIAMMRPMSIRLGREEAGRTDAVLVSANFFDVLGVRLERGRGFLAEEDLPGSPLAVVVLGYESWRRLGADPDLVGRSIVIDAMPFRVVGVASREFVGADHGRLWIPLAALQILRPRDPVVAGLLTSPTDCCVNAVARLSKASSKEEAAAELTVLSNQFRASTGQKERPIIVSSTEFLSEQPRSELLAIFAILSVAVTLVLIMACANVGNLLLARAAARAREIGARLALGASRGRVVRQLLTEGFVLAAAASAIGGAMSFWMPPLVLHIATGDARPFDTTPDAFVAGYALVIAASSCLVFAVAPALHATRAGVAEVLKAGPAALAVQSGWSVRTLLLATQVAVSVVLLTGAGLLGHGVDRIRHLNLGFSHDDVGIATFDLPPNAYDDARLNTMLEDLSEALRTSPVASFGFVSTEPFGDGGSATSVRLPGESDAQARRMDYLEVSPGYFEVLRIPVVAGRDFRSSDAGRPVALINESMARRHWPGRSALGQSFYGAGPQALEIIGITRDARTDGFEQPEPEFYTLTDPPAPMSRQAPSAPKLLFRPSAPGAAEAIRAIVRRLDERVRVDIRPLGDNITRSVSALVTGPALAALLGIFALALATVGMFGVFSYVVQQRKKEIGIRIALGARPAAIVALVLAGNSPALAAGLIAGIAGAVGVSRVLEGYLYGLSPLDPITYGGVALLLALAGFAASYGPARRATRTDPITALRTE
jgi:predicted permease